MRKIFIDAGAYDGDTIREFFNWGKMIGDPNEYEIYAFEPNPNMYKILDDTASQHDNVTFINKAVWIEDGQIEFAVDTTATPLGSTAEVSKSSIWDTMPHETVESVDFSNWIKQFDGCEVLLKMDIEGAEFSVLSKMLKDGTMKIVNKLMCEFHPNKVSAYTTTDKDDLIKKIEAEGVEVKLWH